MSDQESANLELRTRPDSTEGKKKRKRPTAADWDSEYPNITMEIPEDGGLPDEQLMALGLDDKYTTKKRRVTAPMFGTRKGSYTPSTATSSK